MYHSSTIKLAAVEKSAARDGFAEPYHKVTFELISEGIPKSQMVVWVHPAYPDDDLVRVAQTFAWRRLLDLSEAASENAFSEEEIQLLWERVKPANF
ncbi:hypothetical protein [Fischerella sp. PCC 9605]|uniref:hypothetical protein n=1 Tax=Fischerella sp. PCC 9605 TaxID=1173024 RepID=UPI00047C93F1|nr:hypothetical protein [Fischerella sp. PCC 9605]